MERTYKYFETLQTGQVTVLRMNGAELRDHLILDELSDELDQFGQDQQPDNLVVSLRELDWATSIVINALIKLRRTIIDGGGSIRLCAMKTSVRDSFRVLKLDGTLFSIYETEEEALDGF